MVQEMAIAILTVAKIDRDHDHREDDLTESQVGRPFEYAAMMDWWGHADVVTLTQDMKRRFRLLDDDGTTYYCGWLFNDDECIVQQFVLAWASTYAGCTTIQVKHPLSHVWETEIG